MINRGFFLVKVLKQYNPITDSSNMILSQSFLAEVHIKSKTNKKLITKLRFIGKVRASLMENLSPNVFYIVEGALNSISCEFAKVKNEYALPFFYELTVYKLYLFSEKVIPKKIDQE